MMDVGAALVADGQAAEAVEPGQRALDDPAVPAEPVPALDTPPSNARFDVTPAAGPAAGRIIISLVGVQLIGSAAGSSGGTPDRRDGIECGFEHQAVVPVGRAQQAGQRRAPAVNHNMALRARFATIGRVRADFLAPLLAGTVALSRAARLQSTCAAAPSRFNSSRWSRSHTPALCQSRRRRQQVMPDPQPISRGSISQGMPLFSTNRMPLSAARSSSGGRPPLGLGRGGGNSSATADHSSSETRGFAIPGQTPLSQFC